MPRENDLNSTNLLKTPDRILREIIKIMTLKILASGSRFGIISLSSPLSYLMSHNINARERACRSLNTTAPPDRNPASRAVKYSKAGKNGVSKRPNHSESSHLIKLSKIITKETRKLNRWLKKSGSLLGFGIESPLKFPALGDKVERARAKIIRATEEMSTLVRGPTDSLRWIAWGASVP